MALILAVAVGASQAAATTSQTITGPITVLGSSWFTLQSAGRQVGVINALTAAATRITEEDTPYVWGGGHAEAGVASIGIRGPGYNRKRRGFDCSGAVAAVLSAAGLWPAGAGVPADSGVISELLAAHLIARGVGIAPDAVTLYDDPGVHIFMNIDGRFFGTSDGSGGGDANGGAGWLDDGAWDAIDPAFKKYHFLPSVLDERTSYGNDYTFQLPTDGLFPATGAGQALGLGELSISDLLVGERIRVSFRELGSGELVAQSITVISGGPAATPPGTTVTTPLTTTTTTTTTTGTTTTPGTTTTATTTAPVTTTTPTTTTTTSTTTTTTTSGTTAVPPPGGSSNAARNEESGGSALTSSSGGSGLSRPAVHHPAKRRHGVAHRHR